MVNVDFNARFSLGVESRAQNSRWSGSSRSGNLEVHTLGVVLSSIDGPSRVEGNDLVTKNIVTRSDIFGDRDSPGIVVGNQLIRSPSTWGCGIINESDTVDLEEFQSRLINSLAVTTAVGKIICAKVSAEQELKIKHKPMTGPW